VAGSSSCSLSTPNTTTNTSGIRGKFNRKRVIDLSKWRGMGVEMGVGMGMEMKVGRAGERALLEA